MKELRPITKEEWEKYEWIEITAYGDKERIWIKGRELAKEPNDEYVYYDAARLSSNKQEWRRRMTYVEE